MSPILRYSKLVLLVLTLLYAGVTVRAVAIDLQGVENRVYADGVSPVGGDFVNMYAAGRLVLEGRAAEVYLPEALMAFEQTIIPHNIGLRLWAYPPHSLLLAWPFALTGFEVSLVVWSVLGLLLLGWGARRAGFDWIEVAIITLSPAALACVQHGQTGNAVAGLLLLALSGAGGGIASPLSAALLTVKPHGGFLLPVLWLRERKFRAIALAAALTIGLGLLSLALFGPGAWRDYLGASLGALHELETRGSGPFLYMIPSAFIAMRLYAGDLQLATGVGIAVAAIVAAVGVWGLWRSDDRRMRWAIAIATMALITPYIHIYDLAPALAAALIVVATRRDSSPSAQFLAALVALAVWALPMITMLGNAAGIPAGFLILVSLLVVTCVPAAAPASLHPALSQKSIS